MGVDSDFQHRCSQTAVMKKKYPDRVPIFLRTDTTIINLTRNKFMIPRDFTCAEFIAVIRNRLSIQASEALFFLSIPKKKLLCGATNVGRTYDSDKSEDGFLHVMCTLEKTFGLAVHSAFGATPAATTLHHHHH